jgi:hypothetical protein
MSERQGGASPGPWGQNLQVAPGLPVVVPLRLKPDTGASPGLSSPPFPVLGPSH